MAVLTWGPGFVTWPGYVTGPGCVTGAWLCNWVQDVELVLAVLTVAWLWKWAWLCDWGLPLLSSAWLFSLGPGSVTGTWLS